MDDSSLHGEKKQDQSLWKKIRDKRHWGVFDSDPGDQFQPSLLKQYL